MGCHTGHIVVLLPALVRFEVGLRSYATGEDVVWAKGLKGILPRYLREFAAKHFHRANLLLAGTS